MSDEALQLQNSSFSVHNRIRMKAQDIEGRKQLSRHMIRTPFALEKMTHDKQTGMGEPAKAIHLANGFPGERPHNELIQVTTINVIVIHKKPSISLRLRF